MNDRLGKHVREGSAIGIKPASEFAASGWRQAIQYAIDHKPSVGDAGKGNIMKFTPRSLSRTGAMRWRRGSSATTW